MSHDRMLFARSTRHLTTVRLLWAGLWEVRSNCTCWCEWLYSEHQQRRFLIDLLCFMCREMQWGVDDGSSTVNCMLWLIELRWSWTIWIPFVSKQALESSTYRFHHRGLIGDMSSTISSTSCITNSAITVPTDDPIAQSST